MSGSSTSPRAAHASFRGRYQDRHKPGSEGRATKLTRVFAVAECDADKSLDGLTRTLVPLGDISPPQRISQSMSASHDADDRPAISCFGNCRGGHDLAIARLPDEDSSLNPDTMHQHGHPARKRGDGPLMPPILHQPHAHALSDDQRFTRMSRMCAAS